MKAFFFSILLALPVCVFSQNGNVYSIDDAPSNNLSTVITLGYVNKYWQTDFGSRVVNENFWGQEGKKIHGVQVGIGFQPCLPMGLGLSSGLYYEYYYSVSQAVKDAGYDDFREHNLYLPIHALYRIPIKPLINIGLYGGIGFNWAMWGSYNVDVYYRGSDWTHSRVEEWQKYGNGENPRHLNAQWEAGCFVRIHRYQLAFTYSRGLTNHHLYKGYKTQQNKIGITLGVEINGDYD